MAHELSDMQDFSNKYLSVKDFGKNKLLQFWTVYSVRMKADSIELVRNDLNGVVQTYSLRQAIVTLQNDAVTGHLRTVTLGSSSGEDVMMFKSDNHEELLGWSRRLRYNIRLLDKEKATELTFPQPESNFHGKVLDLGWAHIRNVNQLEDYPTWARKFFVLTDFGLFLMPVAPKKNEDLLNFDVSINLVETRVATVESAQDTLKIKKHIFSIRNNQYHFIIATETNTETLHWINSIKKVIDHIVKKSKQYSFLVTDKSSGSYFSVGLIGGIMQRDSRMHLLWSYGLYHLRNLTVNPGDFALHKGFQDALGKTATVKPTSTIFNKNEKLALGQIVLDFGQRNPKINGKHTPLKLSLATSIVSVVNILLNILDTAALHPDLVPKPALKSKENRDRASSNPDSPVSSILLPPSNDGSFSALFDAPSISLDDNDLDRGRKSEEVSSRPRSNSNPVDRDDKTFTWDKQQKKLGAASFLPRSGSNLKNSIVPQDQLSPPPTATEFPSNQTST